MEKQDVFEPSVMRPICVRRILEIVGNPRLLDTLNPATLEPDLNRTIIHGVRCDEHNTTVALNINTGRLSRRGCPPLDE